MPAAQRRPRWCAVAAPDNFRCHCWHDLRWALRWPSSWPADRVERWPVAKLVPNARNARTHSDEQVAQLAASIEEWGWTIPVLVDEAAGIIAGHGRVMAAHRLGIEDVPVMVAAGWSDAKKRAYMLADNKLTLNAEWDLERLAIASGIPLGWTVTP